MKCALLILTVVASATVGSPVMAANSTNGASPEARTEGGIAGDPRGAIRALGGTSQTDFEPGSNKVDVPKLGGGSIGTGDTAGAPAGTSGPR